MSVNVTELQKRIHSMIAQDPDGPTAGSDDWNLYLKYLNMAQHEWQEAYPWPTLFKEVNSLSSTSTANATYAMPSDFRKLDGFMNVCDETNSMHSYSQILPDQKSQYSTTDRFFYILGYPGSYNMVINPGTHGSGASISYSYWCTAASLASPTDVSLCPDPQYLVQRSVAYLLEARDDGRFGIAKDEAAMILNRMLEFESARGVSYDDRVKTVGETKYGFRLGRD